MGKTLEELTYSPLIEEDEDVAGWDKETVTYAMQNKRRIMATMKGIAIKHHSRNIQPADVDDMFSDLVMYLHDHDDYDINKAIERSSNGTVVGIEGYVFSCAKFCTSRYCKEMNFRHSNVVGETTMVDQDNELSLFNSIPDTKAEINIDSIIYDLPTVCKSCEPLRYKFGPDIYQVWFVRLLTSGPNQDNIFKSTLEVLGISSRELMQLELHNEDAVMLSIAKAVNLAGTRAAIDEIRKYVYAASSIERTVLAQIK